MSGVSVNKHKKFTIKKDDQIQVMSGKAKGQTGKILRLDKVGQRVFVEGVNMLFKHYKPRRQEEKAEIIKIEGPIHISNVLLMCSNCKKGVRVKTKTESSGIKNRQCAKCGEIIS